MLCLVCELFIINTSAIDCLGRFEWDHHHQLTDADDDDDDDNGV